MNTREPGRQQRPGFTVSEVLRGLWAVLLLFLTGLDALLTAVVGVRPLSPLLSRLGHVIADEYRAGRHDWIDADIVDEPECDVEP